MKLAQVNFSGIQSASGVSLTINSVGELISKITPFLFAGAGLILLLNLIYGGISLMTSRGDPKGIEGAKGRITASLIGFIIIFAAFWIVQIVGIILGIKDIRQTFGVQ